MKRSIAAIAAILVCGLLTLRPALGTAQTRASWPTFHGDNTRDGVSPGSGPMTANIAEQWQLPKPINSSPVVNSSGTAYVGDDDGNVYSYSPSDPNAPKWVFKTQAAVASTPSLSPDEKTVYVGSDDGHVYAIDAATGNQVWATALTSAVRGSPLVSGDGSTIYVADVNGNVSALKAKDGTISWTLPLNSSLNSSLTFGGFSGDMYAAPFGAQVMDAITTGGTTSGSVTTTYYLDGNASSSPATDQNGFIYIGTQHGVLMAFSPGTSTASWTFNNSDHVPIRSTPAIYSGVVYLGDDEENLYAVNEQTHQAAWTVHTGGPVTASPALASGNGVLYAGSGDGAVYAISIAKGQMVWTKALGAAINASPALAGDGSLWVGTLGGTLYRFQDVAATNTPTPSPTAPPTATPTPLPTLPATVAPPVPTSTNTPALEPTTNPKPRPKIAINAGLAKSTLQRGSTQQITVITAAGATLLMHVRYPDGHAFNSHGKANGQGFWQHSWKIRSRRAGTVTVHLVVSHAKARRNYTLHFKVT